MPTGGGRRSSRSRAGSSWSGLPLLLLLAWVVAARLRHVVFLFLVAALIALLLDPLVARCCRRVRIPRGLAVAIVYLSFAGALVVTIGALATVVVDQTKTAANRVDAYFTKPIGQDRAPPTATSTASSAGSTRTTCARSTCSSAGTSSSARSATKDVGRYTSQVVDFVEGAAISVGKPLFALVLLVVVSIYMLLDLPRLQARLDRRFPPRPGSGSLLPRIERRSPATCAARLLLSLIIGDERRPRALAPRRDSACVPGGGQVGAALRRLGRDHRARPVHRAVARRGPAVRSTRSSSTRSRRSGSRCCSSASTSSRATSSRRT